MGSGLDNTLNWLMPVLIILGFCGLLYANPKIKELVI